MSTPVTPPHLDVLLKLDGYLTGYKKEICRRYGVFSTYLKRINDDFGGIDAFTRGYERFGMHIGKENQVECLEWAPGADRLFLMGDFSELRSLSNAISWR